MKHRKSDLCDRLFQRIGIALREKAQGSGSHAVGMCLPKTTLQKMTGCVLRATLSIIRQGIGGRTCSVVLARLRGRALKTLHRKTGNEKSLLQNSVSLAEALQFLALWATKHAFLAVALANLKFCKRLKISRTTASMKRREGLPEGI